MYANGGGCGGVRGSAFRSAEANSRSPSGSSCSRGTSSSDGDDMGGLYPTSPASTEMSVSSEEEGGEEDSAGWREPKEGIDASDCWLLAEPKRLMSVPRNPCSTPLHPTPPHHPLPDVLPPYGRVVRLLFSAPRRGPVDQVDWDCRKDQAGRRWSGKRKAPIVDALENAADFGGHGIGAVCFDSSAKRVFLLRRLTLCFNLRKQCKRGMPHQTHWMVSLCPTRPESWRMTGGATKRTRCVFSQSPTVGCGY